MKVVIISSLKREAEIKMCKNYFENVLGAEAVSPLDYQYGSLREIQERYVKLIKNADLIVAIPKDIDVPAAKECRSGYIESILFGESTSYELAIARSFGKPILYWPIYSPLDILECE